MVSGRIFGKGIFLFKDRMIYLEVVGIWFIAEC